MKLIMENWKKFVNEVDPMPRDVGLGQGPTGLTGLGLSRVDRERLAAGGAGVAELDPHAEPKTWNIENGVLAALDEEGQLWFKRPHGPGDLDAPLAELEAMGYEQSADLPVPSWT